MRAVAAGLAFTLLAITSAAADGLTDCTRSREQATRISACTEIIQGAAYSPEQKGAAFRSRASARLDAGAGDQAIADYTEAIRLNPRDAAAFAGRAQAYQTRANPDAALADFTTAIEIGGSVSVAAGYLIGRGHTYLIKGQHDAAIADFTEALRINPKSAAAYNNRGLAYRTKGDADKAIEDYTAAITLNPVYAQAYANRGYAFENKGSKDEAVADFNRALLLDRAMVGAAEGLKRLKATSPLGSDSDALAAQGKAIVEANCSRCHATGASGASPNPKAPEFRNVSRRHPALSLREPLSRGIAAPHDEMPRFMLSDIEIDKIIAYVNTLGPIAKN